MTEEYTAYSPRGGYILSKEKFYKMFPQKDKYVNSSKNDFKSVLFIPHGKKGKKNTNLDRSMEERVLENFYKRFSYRGDPRRN